MIRKFRIAAFVLLGSVLACKGSTTDTGHSITTDVPGRLAFQSDRSGNFEIYFTGSSGTSLDNISQNIFDNTIPSLSLSGDKLVYLSDRDTVRNIFLFQNKASPMRA